MKRFVTYLYEYTGIVKGRNVGFVKADLRGEVCRIEVHIRALAGCSGTGEIFFIIEDSGFQGVHIGSVELRRGNGDFRGVTRCNPIEATPYQFGQIAAVAVIFDGDKMIATKWKEDPNLLFEWKDVTIWHPKQEDLQGPEEETKGEPKEEAPGLPQEEHRESEEEPQIPREAPLQEQQIADRTQTEWEKQWKEMTGRYEPFDFRKERGGSWIRIDIKGLRELPKRNWYLGNNSFLLHGLLNYRYLILGMEQEDGRPVWYLGVPGYYQQQERVMATIFGFPDFFNSQNGEEPFGYWMHIIDV